MASETWRLELQPLGVRVITLVTLGVKTNSFADKPLHEIPETSDYYEIRDFIHGLSDGRLQASGVTTRKFATQVVREVDKGAVGTVWAGGNSSMVSFTWWILPQFLRVSLLFSRIQYGRLIELEGYNGTKYHPYSCRDGQGFSEEEGLSDGELSGASVEVLAL